MNAINTQQTDSARQCLLSALTVIFLCWVLQLGSLPVVSVGAAIWFTVFLGFYRDNLRSRSGSLTPAFCLTAFLWLCAAVVVVLWFLGAH